MIQEGGAMGGLLENYTPGQNFDVRGGCNWLQWDGF